MLQPSSKPGRLPAEELEHIFVIRLDVVKVAVVSSMLQAARNVPIIGPCYFFYNTKSNMIQA
jgi:hypothetical protein